MEHLDNVFLEYTRTPTPTPSKPKLLIFVEKNTFFLFWPSNRADQKNIWLHLNIHFGPFAIWGKPPYISKKRKRKNIEKSLAQRKIKIL